MVLWIEEHLEQLRHPKIICIVSMWILTRLRNVKRANSVKFKLLSKNAELASVAL